MSGLYREYVEPAAVTETGNAIIRLAYEYGGIAEAESTRSEVSPDARLGTAWNEFCSMLPK
jgi:hypothetical protein